MFKHPPLRGFLYKVTHTITEEEYNKALDQMHDIYSETVNWLLKYALREYWCKYYFPSQHYSHITLNITESLMTAL